MSGEATGFVWKSSPYRGPTLVVHLAIADVVNDAHDNEFYMPMTALARKARVSRSAAFAAVKTMIADGYLTRLTAYENPGEAVRYRFETRPGDGRVGQMGDVHDPDGYPSTIRTGPVHDPDGSKTTASNARERKRSNAKRAREDDHPTMTDHFIEETFAAFMLIYPRRVGRDAARVAFERRVRGTSPKRYPQASVQEILEGAKRFAADPNLPAMQYVPHPATWINEGRWSDDPLPVRNDDHPSGRGDLSEDAIVARLEDQRRKREGGR